MTDINQKVVNILNPTDKIKKFKNGLYHSTFRAKADRADINDLLFKNAFTIDPTKWKEKNDNREGIGLPYDQGNYGSCTANSIGKHVKKAHKLNYDPSRMFIYAFERLIEGTPLNVDSGAELRDGMKVVSKIGVVPETEWAYTDENFSRQPTDDVVKDALKELVHNYYRLTDINDYTQVLNNGYIFSFGLTIYQRFESQEVAKTGFLPLPQLGEKVCGGHAISCVGNGKAGDFLTEDAIKYWKISPDTPGFLILNSWGGTGEIDLTKKIDQGNNWGIQGSGYFFLPADYFKDQDLVTDVWVIFPN